MKANKIQEGMLIFIVGFIKNTEDDVILWKCFNKLDKNHDGSISREELKSAMRTYLRMNDKDATKLSNAVF
jgi:Ca2+-binding EF-hand superfamily protein